MLAKFEGVKALETGEYDLEVDWPTGKWKPRYLDLYDHEQGEVLRLSVGRDVELDVEFGDVVNLGVTVSNETKVVKGTDRTMTRHKMQVVRFENVSRKPAPKAQAA